MAVSGPHTPGSLEHNPDVIEARRHYAAALRSMDTAPQGYKTKRAARLQRALHALIKAENAAAKRHKPLRRAAPQVQTLPPRGQTKNDDPFMTRESGDDTNYRPLKRNT